MAESTDYWKERREGARHPGSFVCRFLAEGRSSEGLVRNASVRGLFVETRAAPAPGSTVRICITDEAGRSLEAVGVVVRRVLGYCDRSFHGLGLVIHGASRDFLRWVAGACQPWLVRRICESDRYRFRVLAKSRTGPKLRTLAVSGSDVQDAKRLAHVHLGEGWTLLEVSEDF